MIDRALAPVFREVENIELIKAKPLVFSNGIKVFVVNGGEQDITRLELIFNNVAFQESNPLLAYAVNSMLTDGTSERNASQIAEGIDYYGAFLQTDYNNDHSSVTLYSLNKHLHSTLSIVKDVLTDSIFPETELKTFVTNQKQKLSVNLEKNDFLGRKKFNNVLFGDSLYGYNIEHKDYDVLTSTELLNYYRKSYVPGNCTIVISGKVEETTLKLVEQTFGGDWKGSITPIINEFNFSPGKGILHFIEKEAALQSAVRVGSLAIMRNHPDFPGFQVLNTLLGGYFGSRLMANIREDKGYTYGIGSALVSQRNSGYFFIATEVGADVCAAALEEIKRELALLSQEKVSEMELGLVRNYMLGSMLGSLENAMSHADKFKNIYFSGLGYDYYENYIRTVRTIEAEDILRLAVKYLDFESMEKVVVGKL